MKRKTYLIPLAVALIQSSLYLGFAVAQVTTGTRAVADRYIELTFSRQYDALNEIYAENVVFEDPTADVFQGPIAEGPIQGAETVIAMQKSWGLDDTTFELEGSFTAGQYSLYRGILKTGYPATENRPAQRFDIPFVTILRVEDTRIAERLDFGEYVQSFRLGDAFDENTESTRDVADRYRDAYLSGDLTTQAWLMHDDIVFQDPTARVIGEAEGSPIEGAKTLIKRRRPMYEGVDSFELQIDRSFYANHHAVYMGTVSYRLKTGPKFVQPGVLALEVRDGKVRRHWDFVDYSVPSVEQSTREETPSQGLQKAPQPPIPVVDEP